MRVKRTVAPLLTALSAALLLPVALGAQTTLTWSDATLGGTVNYALSGDAGEIFGFKPSLSTGPVPLPGGTLNIGLDLINLLTVGALSPATGSASLSFSLPADPSFIGLPIHAQFVTFPGVGVLIDDVSNRATFVASFPNDVQSTFSPNHVARSGHTLTNLPDGSALVAGGDDPQPGGTFLTLDSLERYDPATQEFTLLSTTLTSPRSTHTSTILSDGRILLAGGYSSMSNVLATAEIYDPVTGTIAPTGPMNAARTQHTATRLADGRVFVVGGSGLFDLSAVISSLLQSVKSSEIYDPVTNMWTAGPSLPLGSDIGVIGQAASLIGSGHVLITGGVRVASFLGIPLPSFSDDAWRYDPISNSIVSTAGMSAERAYHGQVTLPSGTAMIVGGADGDFVALSFFTRTTCETYDSSTNSWSASPSLANSRAYPNLVDTGDAIVCIGGLSTVDVTTGSGAPEQIIETIPYALAAWTNGPATLLPREIARAVSLDGGNRILFVGTGIDGLPTADKTAEQFVR